MNYFEIQVKSLNPKLFHDMYMMQSLHKERENNQRKKSSHFEIVFGTVYSKTH